MEALISATVLMVWGLGALVAVCAWIASASHRVNCEVAMGQWLLVDRKCAALNRAPVVLARTPLEMSAFMARYRAAAATIATGERPSRVPAPADIQAAWLAQDCGLRYASDVATTVVDHAPVSAAEEASAVASANAIMASCPAECLEGCDTVGCEWCDESTYIGAATLRTAPCAAQAPSVNGCAVPLIHAEYPSIGDAWRSTVDPECPHSSDAWQPGRVCFAERAGLYPWARVRGEWLTGYAVRGESVPC